MSLDNEMDIPSEILEDLQSFHENLKKMQDVLVPLTTTNVNSLDVQLPSLDRARLNLISGYALNSLYWMYLNTLGEDSKHHRIKTELERYKSFMQTVKEITDKDKAPHLNKDAAKRFVRNAIWEPNVDRGQIITGRLSNVNEPSTSRNGGVGEDISDNHLVLKVINLKQLEENLLSYQNSQRLREEKMEMDYPSSNLIPQAMGHGSTSAQMEPPNNNPNPKAIEHGSTSAQMELSNNDLIPQAIEHGSTSAQMEHLNNDLIPQAIEHGSTSAQMEHPNSDPIPQAMGRNRRNRRSRSKENPLLDGNQVLQLTKTVLLSLSCGLCFKRAVQLKKRGRYPVFLTSCNHFYCAPCLWRKNTTVCPICQQPLENLKRERMYLV